MPAGARRGGGVLQGLWYMMWCTPLSARDLRLLFERAPAPVEQLLDGRSHVAACMRERRVRGVGGEAHRHELFDEHC